MIGGLVLAAGAGRRFGAEPKLLAELNGRPLLAHAVAAMQAVPAIERTVVVLGAHAERVQAEVELGDAEVVVCGDWAEGQAASLRCGVRALMDDAEAILVILGDQPLMTPQVIAGVLDQRASAFAAVRARYDGQPGHPVLLEGRLYGRLLDLRGDQGARDLLSSVAVRDLEATHLGRPDDVDTPDQLEALTR